MSVLRKAKEKEVIASFAKTPEESNELERFLVQFPDVVARAGKEYAPHFIVSYLTALAGTFNRSYATTIIVDAKDVYSPYRVALTNAFAVVMRNGLAILGIPILERM